MTDLLLAPIQTAAATTVQIKLFGSPRLLVEQQAVSLPRRQMRALLYRLAASLQPVAREQLCFLLWPDTPEATARRYLTVLLNQLRQALPAPNLLLAQQDAIVLNSAAIEVDTIVLAQALAAASTERTIEQTVTRLSEAVALYDGPFLHGFTLSASPEFDAWADQERHTWERRYLDGLALLVDGHAAQGAYGLAIGVAQQALAVDALAEDMHRRLIELYAAVGDRSGALRQFERCVVALERELGVSPLPETRAVYQDVRDGRLRTQRPSPLQTIAGATITAAEAPPTTRLLKLPAAPAPLLGRTTELAQASAILIDPTVRLLTLCGPGGSGKTRLSQQIAWDVADLFADGAVFVPLAALRDPALVIAAIASLCELKQTSVAAVVDYLQAKQMLLVLDNCEHLLDAGPDIAALLRAAPNLHILATSRAALNVQGEHSLFVPPLPLPDLRDLPPLDALANVPSVALLLARTQALAPSFELCAENAADLAAICVRLDGLPLAIELAAARLKLLAPRDLLRRLDRRLAVLTSGARDLPDRQQTLRATIDWSYRLLDTDQQIWFERCSVFVGGWTLAAAEGLHEQLGWPGYGATETLDALAALVDKSLIQVSAGADGETRFTMLETIREFAAERLYERGASTVVAQAHADCFRELVEPWDVNAPEWLGQIERDLDNLRAALRWYGDSTDGAEFALRLGNVLARFWYWRDQISEGRRWLDQVVRQSAGLESEARADVLNWSALFANVQGDTVYGTELHQASLQVSKQLQLLRPQANSLIGLGTMYARKGDYPGAIAAFEESLAIGRQLDNPTQLANACYMLANVLIDQGTEIARGLALYEECLATARKHGMKVVESMALAALGEAYALMGELARAETLLPEALCLQRDMKATMAISWTLLYLGVLAYQQANDESAQQYLFESLDASSQGGAQFVAPIALEGMAGVLSMRLQGERAVRLLGAAEALRESLDLQRPPIEQPFYNRILASVRSQLSEIALHKAWQVGRKLNLEQAIGEAKAVAA